MLFPKLNWINPATLAALCACLFFSIPYALVGQPDCAADRPCFNAAYQSCRRVIFQFDGVHGWDFYNVRYHVSSGNETQVENRSGRYTIDNTKPAATYTIKVQGCNSRVLGHSDCSPCVEESVTTASDSGPDTCKSSFVWRNASARDHVCVTPAERDQVAVDNAAGSSKRQPGGGPGGPDTCLQGYVLARCLAGRSCLRKPCKAGFSAESKQFCD